jgi:hypothetical protein
MDDASIRTRPEKKRQTIVTGEQKATVYGPTNARLSAGKSGEMQGTACSYSLLRPGVI